jgi:ATP-dependent 26S proteasome regulatory subunit
MTAMFTSPLEHITAELQRLDLLLHREILRLRATYQLSLDEFRGLYISDEQVNSLIDQSLGYEGEQSIIEELTQRAEALREANAARLHSDLPWQRLANEFSLAPIEQDILLLAIAPEIDLKYETLYAYLNNDITRKWPTHDLALRVLSASPAERSELRPYLSPHAALFAGNFLHTIDPTFRASSLAHGFTLMPALVDYLLGYRYEDARLTAFTETVNSLVAWNKVPLVADAVTRFRQVAKRFKASHGALPLLLLEGRPGAGRSLAARALCGELDLTLLKFDLEAARASPEPLSTLIAAALLQSRLEPAGLYLEGIATLFDNVGKPLPEAHALATTLTGHPRPVFLACTPGTQASGWLKRQSVLGFHFPEPDFSARVWLWQDALTEQDTALPADEIHLLAGRFILNPGQIQAAAETAAETRELTGTLDSMTLFEAARAQSDRSLGALAVKVKPIHCWDDLILPTATQTRIRELASAIRFRHVVYAEWGFERRIASGRGVKALFAGGSGTGKTMTASVIAQDLGLDLYKIDLSSIVSKYIGETEKNLDRIFQAAQSSNAILFFDEADALFGKRSEVKDAHDRYANIEVSYLLQKVEDHEGVVILASNLSKNIDEAFSRRLHYVIDFPLPDETHRERLWRGMLPPEAPLAKDLDWQFLAKQFSIAGGDIRNVALDAAFLAAQDGRVITMKQLINAMARQMMKQGRIPSPTDFKQYHGLIGEGE